MKKSLAIFVFSLILFSCASNKPSESERIKKQIRKGIKFPVDSLTRIDAESWSFANNGVAQYPPDYFIGLDGVVEVAHAYFGSVPSSQSKEMIWRNLFFSKRAHRIICVDRMLSNGRTNGVIYVMQSAGKHHSHCGTYQWDVTRKENIQMAGTRLDDLRLRSLSRLKRLLSPAANAIPLFDKPSSQDEYWLLMFHADSLYHSGHYEDAIRTYDRAFSEDRYILPSQPVRCSF